MRKQILIALVCSAVGVNVAAQESTAKVGAQLWEQHNCASCHGADAKTSVDPSYPILAGQHADYLKQALLAYQKGQAGAPPSANIRKNPVMGAMAATLKPQEVDELTTWLASLPGPLSTRRE